MLHSYNYHLQITGILFPTLPQSAPEMIPVNYYLSCIQAQGDCTGMDAYVRALTDTRLHDEFYTSPTILNAFLNSNSDSIHQQPCDIRLVGVGFLKVSSPSLKCFNSSRFLSELANDLKVFVILLPTLFYPPSARCNSSLYGSPQCNTNTITVAFYSCATRQPA